MKNKETLGDLMKQYEGCWDMKLPKRIPIIVRLDMKAGHGFTKGFEKPFDRRFSSAMHKTMADICREIQGARFGYAQSDEISILLYETKPEAESWFDNRIQKLCSVSASFCTLKFNRNFGILASDYFKECIMSGKLEQHPYHLAFEKGATFDSRCFCIPESLIVPYFIWRQNDAIKNSINSLAQGHFSHKELLGLDGNRLQDKLLVEKGISWNDLPNSDKRGACCYPETVEIETENGKAKRTKWIIDYDMPILTKDKGWLESKIHFL